MWMAAVLGVLFLSSTGCREEAVRAAPSDTGEYPAGLSPKQAAMVLAKVGDHSITLGEYAAALDRMDSFDRLRYRSAERRRELLDEMIKVELLAKEAERRGLDKEPETQQALRQILRDALLDDARKTARAPADIPVEEVRAYYDANKDQYAEPERRRLSHLTSRDRAQAEELYVKAKALPNMEAWGRFVIDNSQEYRDDKGNKNKDHSGPFETAGDLGLVGPPGDIRGANPRVPEPVRAAVFEVANAGEMVDRVIENNGTFHLVRLVAVTKAHTRSYEEAERTIRIMMADREKLAKEQQLEEELRKKFPVTIDDAALADVKTPAPKLFAPPPAPAHDHDEDDHDHVH